MGLMILSALIFLLTWMFLFLIIYFIPVIIAFIRNHNNIAAITVITVFLGWSFLGWLGALLWSLNSDIKNNENL